MGTTFSEFSVPQKLLN